MSSILKALKKLEEEQAGRPDAPSPRPGGQFVAPTGSPRRTWMLLAAGVGVGLLLAGGLFLAVREPAAPLPAVPSVQHPVNAPSPPPVAVSQPPVVLPAATKPRATTPVTGPPPSAPVVRGAISPAPESPSAAPPVPAQPVPASSDALVAASTAATPDRVEQVRVDHREIPLPGQQWAAPQLTVSDILPASGGERMAIVNGLPVMEGTQVENALVEEILADRVRFVIDGKVVEVRVSVEP